MHPTPPADAVFSIETLHDNLPAGVVVHGADGRIVSANRLAQELLGRSETELLGAEASADTWTFVREDGSPLPPEEFPANLVLKTGRKLSGLVAGVVGPGGTCWLLCNAYPEFDAAGSVRQVVVCFTDCTVLKNTQQSLEKSEKRLRLVLKGSTDAPWDWDLVSGEVYYSERWWNMLGYASGEGLDDAGAWRRMLHPDDDAMIQEYLGSLLPSQRDGYSLEFRLRHRDGHYVSVLSRGYVLRDPAGKALRISGVNTDLTERKETERRIYELAFFDHLTGLPNRRFLIGELDHVLARGRRSGHYCALLYLDLDNFKLLNDTMGHDLGDMLLRQTAQQLRSTVRHSDQLARLGGDEFVVVLEGLGPSPRGAAAEAACVVAKILAAVGQPMQLGALLFKTTASIGITLFDSNEANIETLLKQADLAMYRAKADGRNTARFFDPSMQDAADRRAAFEAAMRDGLSLGQFRLFCQPQFDSLGGVVGAEVLVRWQRGDHDLIGPDQFIGFAEESGLILPLGEHILKESCRALARWHLDPNLGRLKLAVNVSVHQMRDPCFPAAVAAILDGTGARPERLYLELTESVFAEDMHEISQRMHELRSQGICFALDDFGTGYSSLAYLKRFPLSALKIDRSFVRDLGVDPGSASIVEAIIALARKFKLDIVAEGVEEEAQRDFLFDGGCSSMQGYLLGRPIPIAEFEHAYGAAGIGHA
ncbi:bifunctional diguanylate cyclase/phosphodiesterase [Pseudoduganella albidiflava]|uniref:Bifunctional diguanylate cyclase/phosphodiesterase n=1 Tax=Pseudoduganella albidiflava TaxID=321983 RepID=A0A411WTQ2_9BURK|nr:bifunctional diguanylate cyclase/phosphodiesterase [Pseudoduganella albidiflava]QBI00012.1 bifunctional diguanylate cyclase/phosphodiesterase [Pseudoduganella albidiflava]GGY55546.1 GGDEF domain-containing protein [Pseudoduganella albidiflava]